MFFLDVLSRFAHVGTAITMVGGTMFLLFVLLPSSQGLDELPRQSLSKAVLGRWKRFVHIGILLLLASGIYNYMQAIPGHKGDGLYHGMVGTKMILAFVIFFIASVLVGRSPKFEGMRNNRAKWLKVVVVLACVIVAISAFLKVRGLPS
ncbi:hypothetical protein [Novipirellula caenicola]|uniref:Copper resistance protein D n=1 Tax=Novipirellula caenicola TaxID=1536901 RepID=A0ABP9VUV0_9BACT